MDGFASPEVLQALAVFGGAVGCLTVANVAKFFWRTLLRPGHNLLQRYALPGKTPWALVTGGSDGIGKAFAFELATRGFNIVIVSRTMSKMEAVRSEIKAKHPNTEVRLVGLDMASSSFDETVSTVKQSVSDIDLALVVNNAGTGIMMNRLHLFSEAEVATIDPLLSLNVRAFTAVLVATLPSLAARSQRGGVINVSSFSAYRGFPLNAVYAGSKAYNNIVSQSVAAELAGGKVDVLSFTPAFVSSNLVRSKPSATVASAPNAVKAALAALGHERVAVGTFSHELQKKMADFMPRYAERMITKVTEKTRAKLLAKIAAKQQAS